MTRIETRISGLGGQGVVLAGQILGRAAVYDGKKVVQTQSYGAEARGSAAKSEVIISDERISFPMVRKCDILLVLSQEALNRNIDSLKRGSKLLADEDSVKDIPKIKGSVYRLPIIKTAGEKLKSKLFANAVMLGALVSITNIVKYDAIAKAITATVKQITLEENLRALKIGFNLGTKSQSS